MIWWCLQKNALNIKLPGSDTIHNFNSWIQYYTFHTVLSICPKPKLMAVGIHCADHATPSIR
jgi:hypothetical protein